MRPKISVVIPTYRRPQLLYKCLQALLQQHIRPYEYEIIVVSDGPDELTARQVDKFNNAGLVNIRFLPLDKKKGPAAARNYGWKNAIADLIAFTDDDCIPDSDWLYALIEEYYHKQKAPDFIAFTGRINVPLNRKPTDFELNTSHLETAEFVTANCACSRKALDITGGFDERFEMAWREDSDLEFKLIEQNIRIVKVSEALIVHPARSAKWGVSMKEQKKVMFDALLYKKYPELFRRKIQQHPAIPYYIIIGSFIILIAAALMGITDAAIAAAIIYMFLTVRFIWKRLKKTSHHPRHIAEMVITSLAIPFLSIYWTLYGSWKYKVLYY
jgi:glycosyltransferase involved in cell wall biosynthesis